MIERPSDIIKIVLVIVVLSFGLALKAEEARLKGFFDKFPATFKEGIEKTKEYQKKEWGKLKNKAKPFGKVWQNFLNIYYPMKTKNGKKLMKQ